MLLVIVLTLSYIAYRRTFHTPPARYDDNHLLKRTEQTIPYIEQKEALISNLEKLPFELLHTVAYDGIPLTGQYYHQKDGAPLHICFHGYRATPIQDFCAMATLYLSLGHNILLVRQRGRFGSPTKTITFGVRERFDVVSWASYCAGRFGKDTPILLSGISMGASTVLMASEFTLPETVCGIIADCPYSSPTAILNKYTREMKIPTFIAYPSVWIGARLFGHFSYSRVSAVSAVKKAKIPILLIHGEADRFVPCTMGNVIAEANLEKVALYTFPKAGHCMSYFVDPKRYEALLVQFLNRVLPPTDL